MEDAERNTQMHGSGWKPKELKIKTEVIQKDMEGDSEDRRRPENLREGKLDTLDPKQRKGRRRISPDRSWPPVVFFIWR